MKVNILGKVRTQLVPIFMFINLFMVWLIKIKYRLKGARYVSSIEPPFTYDRFTAVPFKNQE